MTLQTFTASTMAEALLLVKRTFGHDAVILHTRTVTQRTLMGLRRREVVEVTAGPANMHPERRRTTAAPAQRQVSRESARPTARSAAMGTGGRAVRGGSAGAALLEEIAEMESARPAGAGLGGATGVAAAYARNSVATATRPTSDRTIGVGGLRRGGDAGGEMAAGMSGAMGAGGAGTSGAGTSGTGAVRSFVGSPEITQAMVKLVTEEVTGLRSELKELVTQVRRGGAGGGSTNPNLPEQLFTHYRQLIENQVAEELAEAIIKAVRLAIPAGYLGNDAFVREKVAEQLERLVPVSGPIERTKDSGPHVIALIGPTGVGKTTTIAKLAANLQLREGKRVGLITIDTYRIAAVDQLRRYADIIGAPLQVVGRPEEMARAVAAMGELDYILIDTAGRSPTDTLKLSELRGFIDAAKPDEVHLVLSTTASPRCVDMAIAAFSKVRVDRLLFTKIDEAASVGVVLNVAHRVGKALSYVTTGQDVPDDIEVVKGRKLAHLILGVGGAVVSGGSAAGGARNGAGGRAVAADRKVVAGSPVVAGGVQ